MARVRSSAPFALLFVLAVPAAAQTGSGGGSALTLDLLRPAFDANSEPSTFVMYAGARLRLGPGLQFVGEVPLASAGERNPVFGGGGSGSGTMVGNPYLGLRWESGPTSVLEIGLRAPFAARSRYAASTAVLADFGRFEAFLPEVAAVRGAAIMTSPIGEALSVRLTFGGTVMFPTSSQSGDPEAFADYAAGLGLRSGALDLSALVVGRAIVTEHSDTFGEATVHQLALGAAWRRSTVQPSLALRLPLDQDLDPLRFTAGVGVTIVLP